MPVTHGVTGSSPVHTAKSFVGTLTEWLGGGLQNRIQQFESAGYLHKVIHIPVNHFFCVFTKRTSPSRDATSSPTAAAQSKRK